MFGLLVSLDLLGGDSVLFFFSSRRRHTRLTCDWSSDVCSSDLEFDVVFDERVGTDDELRLAGANAIEGGGFLRSFQAADEQLDAIAGFGEDAPRGKQVLHG